MCVGVVVILLIKVDLDEVSQSKSERVPNSGGPEQVV